ncbi:MAG: hypothetical protein HYV63_09350 [Candidatus Schekmanbacteria bacterium]|nr:hypothetical protein [Candidatus Schekmanbacteria bacterium]
MAGGLKSAWEIALEKMGDNAPQAGGDLDDAVKERIGEIRRQHQAKIAELEIMHQSKVKALIDRVPPAELAAKRDQLDGELRARKAEAANDMERKIREARATNRGSR